jgi:small neutral amino acid transporter SnatA (MarC family)
MLTSRCSKVAGENINGNRIAGAVVLRGNVDRLDSGGVHPRWSPDGRENLRQLLDKRDPAEVPITLPLMVGPSAS